MNRTAKKAVTFKTTLLLITNRYDGENAHRFHNNIDYIDSLL